MVLIDKDGLHSERPFPKVKPSFCIFEYIYFARPDSNIFGENVYLVRKKLGARLAEESPADVDFVMPIPDSGNYAALGFAERLGLPFEMGMIRNHYVGRTFIQPSQSVRDFGVRIKLNPVRDLLRGKRVVVDRRFHRPGDYQPDENSGSPGRRGEGSPHEGELPAPSVSLPLRH